MAAISETLFKGVRVKRLDDEGNSVPVYKVPVEVQLEYDPKVDSCSSFISLINPSISGNVGENL